MTGPSGLDANDLEARAARRSVAVACDGLLRDLGAHHAAPPPDVTIAPPAPPDDVRMVIVLDDDLIERLRIVAHAKRLTIETVVSRAIAAYVLREKAF